MPRIKLDAEKVEITTKDGYVKTYTWAVFKELEEAMKIIRDLDAQKTYKRLDIEY